MAIARRQIGMIKRALYWAQERARLIAYRPLCPLDLQYASCALDLFTNKIKALEMVKTQGVRMVCRLKVRRN